MKWQKRLGIFFIATFLFGIFLILGINFTVIFSTKSMILDMDEIKTIENVDAILVLGCQVRSDGTPSAMLEDRLNTGVSLYQNHVAPKMIMSGDHQSVYYNEVKVMKDYAVNQNVSSSNIFLDHAGVSTYDSIIRAKEIFHVRKIVIVTQSYHLYRALYIAKSIGLEAYGVSSDTVTYSNQWYREGREVLARNKDFLLSMIHFKPEISSNDISLDWDGNFTN